MQFRVVIPEHVRAGQYIKVHCPADAKVKGSVSREAELRVPKGLKAGDSFVFDINEQGELVVANDVALLNAQMTAAAAGGDAAANNRGGSFLDREVLHVKDFLVALGIGLLIGVSIVVGFVAGVIYVTRGLPLELDTTYHPFHNVEHHSHAHSATHQAVTDDPSNNDDINNNNPVAVHQLQSPQNRHYSLQQQQQPRRTTHGDEL